MTLPQYTSARELLIAYYAQRQQELPEKRAHSLLISYAFHNGDVQPDFFSDAESVLSESVLDVEDIAENFLGLDLYLQDLSEYDRRAGAPVFGLANPEAGSIKICTRAEEYLPLYRATVMHEVAHVILHHGTNSRSLCYSPRSPRRPPEEREADHFMSEAILPKSLLYLAIVVAGRPHGLQEYEAFRKANTRRGQFQWRKFYFPFLINRLCVSRELVAVRMSQQGHFNESTFNYHRSYALPNRWRKPAPLEFRRVIESALVGA